MLSTRPEKRVGSDDIWEKAEVALEEALKETGIKYTLQEGEGAFYGPKIEYSLKDSLGRIWQCGTIQLDFNLPERLELSILLRIIVEKSGNASQSNRWVNGKIYWYLD